eukprot:PhM_4_TR7739/c0_g1_i1/m.94099
MSAASSRATRFVADADDTPTQSVIIVMSVCTVASLTTGPINAKLVGLDMSISIVLGRRADPVELLREELESCRDDADASELEARRSSVICSALVVDAAREEDVASYLLRNNLPVGGFFLAVPSSIAFLGVETNNVESSGGVALGVVVGLGPSPDPFISTMLLLLPPLPLHHLPR